MYVVDIVDVAVVAIGNLYDFRLVLKYDGLGSSWFKSHVDNFWWAMPF